MEVDEEYLILQTKYHKMNKDKEKIFPDEWYNVKEYNLKTKILKECIQNNILIFDSSFYYEFRLKALNNR